MGRAPHPAAGWIAVMPFPQPDAMSPPQPQVINIGPAVLIDLSDRSMRPGMPSGVVLELGPTAESVDRSVLMPYPEGATVFYPPQAAVVIGGFHFLPATNVIAWDDAP